MQASVADPEQRGNWRDALILLTLGLAVDLRWFDSAWPAGLRGLGNLLLLDAGLYGFLGIRHLSGTGFDFHFRWSDWKIGLRELAFFAPVVIAAGLALGFIHPHANVPSLAKAILSWIGIFVFIAVLEELFFRAWVQNLSGAATRAQRGPGDRIHPFRALAFQQANRPLQLALCPVGHGCGDFLRTGLALGKACRRLRHHPHLRRLAVVVVVLVCITTEQTRIPASGRGTDSSPALQRWEAERTAQVPEGRLSFVNSKRPELHASPLNLYASSSQLAKQTCSSTGGSKSRTALLSF